LSIVITDNSKIAHVAHRNKIFYIDIINGSLLDEIDTGHTADIWALSLSKCNNFILIGYADGIAKLIETLSKTVVQTFIGHKFSINCVNFLNKKGCKAKTILTGSNDNTLKRWDIVSGERITTFRGHTSGVTCVLSDEASNRIYSSSWDNSIICWDVDTGEKIAVLKGHNRCVNSICFINSSPLKIASASNDKTIKIWDTSTFTCIKTLVGHTNFVFNVTAAPDGIHIVFVGYERNIGAPTNCFPSAARGYGRRVAGRCPAGFTTPGPSGSPPSPGGNFFGGHSPLYFQRCRALSCKFASQPMGSVRPPGTEDSRGDLGADSA